MFNTTQLSTAVVRCNSSVCAHRLKRVWRLLCVTNEYQMQTCLDCVLSLRLGVRRTHEYAKHKPDAYVDVVSNVKVIKRIIHCLNVQLITERPSNKLAVFCIFRPPHFTWLHPMQLLQCVMCMYIEFVFCFLSTATVRMQKHTHTYSLKNGQSSVFGSRIGAKREKKATPQLRKLIY